jgi:hypothetical protein
MPADPTPITPDPQLASAVTAPAIELVTQRVSDPVSVANAVLEPVEAKVAAVSVLAVPILDDPRTTRGTPLLNR